MAGRVTLTDMGGEKQEASYALAISRRIERVFAQVEVCVRASEIRNVDPNRGGRGGVFFVGAAV